METMKTFDTSKLTPIVPLNKDELRKIRKDANLTQPELSFLVGVTVKHISNLENGHKKPSKPLLKLMTLLKTKGIEGITVPLQAPSN